MKLAQKLAINYIRAKLHMVSLVSKRKAARKALKLFSTPVLKSRANRPPVFSKGEKLSFTIEKYPVHGYRWLPKHEPVKRILILHGFESNSQKFSAYIAAFIKKGYEVLAFDAPAHGESGGKQITLPLYIKTIHEINARFGPIPSFVAHSFGGLALIHFLEATAHGPEVKIALIAPATETKTAIDKFFVLLGLDEETRKEFDELILERTGKPQEYFSIRRAMENIKASVLWIHDEEDEITPISDVRNVQNKHHENIKFIFTKGLGHRKIYRDEEVMKHVVDFL
jgi:pimeloyl-ACP methyl ester carboxylesterase